MINNSGFFLWQTILEILTTKFIGWNKNKNQNVLRFSIIYIHVRIQICYTRFWVCVFRPYKKKITITYFRKCDFTSQSVVSLNHKMMFVVSFYIDINKWILFLNEWMNKWICTIYCIFSHQRRHVGNIIKILIFLAGHKQLNIIYHVTVISHGC